MMYTDEQLKGSLTSVDRFLLYKILEATREQNDLLKSLLSNGNKQADTIAPDKDKNITETKTQQQRRRNK